MSSDFNFTVTSWFLENIPIKPYFNTQCSGGKESPWLLYFIEIATLDSKFLRKHGLGWAGGSIAFTDEPGRDCFSQTNIFQLNKIFVHNEKTI